jgi:hypothetical protein
LYALLLMWLERYEREKGGGVTGVVWCDQVRVEPALAPKTPPITLKLRHHSTPAIELEQLQGAVLDKLILF